jgi:cobalt/nickel transport system permease protein
VLSVSLLPPGAFVALLVAWLAIVAASVIASLGPFATTRRAWIVAPFALAALPLVFTRAGEPLGSIALGPLDLTVSGQGIREFTTIALKSWVSVQAALLLAFTTPFHELVEGLRQLRLPRIMVAIISFMYRYLAVLTGEAARMSRARAARSAERPGSRAGGTLRWRAAVTGHMVGSLFLRSYERSERIYAAMQARGFDGELRSMPGPPLERSAIVAVAVVLAALVAFQAAAHLVLPRL